MERLKRIALVFMAVGIAATCCSPVAAATFQTMTAAVAKVAATYASVLPSPWQSTDIGNVAASGTAVESGGTFTIEGSGVDIWGTVDEFQFVYQTWNGDGQIVARVVSVENTHNYAKAGVMFRETLDANSKNSLMGITPLKATFQRRVTTDGTTSSTTNAGYTAPRWVRLTRLGDTLIGHRSTNGTDWTQVEIATVSMDANLYVGLAVTSHNNGTLCTGVFENVDVSASALHTLTVNSGSGDGYYEANAVVDITADAPGGQEFDVWTGDTAYVADVNEPNTTVTMPAANVTVTATYTSIGGTYRLLVVAGSGDGDYDSNTVVDIFADQPGQGQTFNVWTGDTGYIANVNEANTTVTMPSSNVTVTAVYSGTPPGWTHFLHNEADGNGDYLWISPNNWSSGLPTSLTSIEIGEDSAGEARHCVLYEPGVSCYQLELAEHANTEGSSLKIKQGATLKAYDNVTLSKDREGYLYVDGTFEATTSNRYFRIGGPWGAPDSNLPADCHVTVSSTGLLQAWVVCINTTHTTSGPSSPWGPTYWSRSTDSELVVNSGVLVAQQGLRMSTTDANRPGLLKLTGTASFTSNADATYGIQMWCGTWQIDGGDANIHVGDIELWGNKFANEVSGYTGNPVGPGKSILKFSGDGVSTIHATSVDFVDAAYLDVADLNVPNGTYKLIDANTVTDANDCLAFVAGTDPNVWSFSLDEANGDLLLTYDSGIYRLDVWNGSGDGDYAPNTVVDILADHPPVGKLFDIWMGDTANIDNVNEPNTTITMPSADTEITADWKADPNYGAPSRGYKARACGFDMNRNGIIGEPADATVGDGNTTDPDGDGTDEDLIYVDATDGNDATGDGSAGNPYKTVQYAMNQADGPGDGAEDIVCIAGVFQETLTLTQGGVAGYYTMDNFQFPNNPFMLIGWDTDKDGEYPPYDADDTAVLDGNVGATFLGLAITNDPAGDSYVEIAHLAIRYYGFDTLGDNTPRGAMKMAPHNVGTVSHIYFHDVDMKSINDGIKTDGYSIIWSLWCGNTPLKHLAMINNRIDGMSCYNCRGAPHNGSGFYRLQNNTYIYTLGEYKETGALELGNLWRVWGEHGNVEFLNNLVYGATTDSNGLSYGGSSFSVRNCVRNYIIRNNELIDCKGGLNVDAYTDGACDTRSVDNIVFDRNIIRNTYTGWTTGSLTLLSVDEGGTLATETAEDVTFTNNFVSVLSTTLSTRGFWCQLGNNGGPQVGVVTFAGNTIYGPGGGSDFTGMDIYSTRIYPQQDFIIKNNIVANVGSDSLNMRVGHDPNGWIANGNIYDDDGNFNWNPSLSTTLTFAEWQTTTGQDGSSRTGDPVFVDDANGDFHIDPNDTLVEGAGVDITDITTIDIDGEERTAGTPWPGADVRLETQQPTILAWHSAAAHGRSVGEALLEIHDDGNFSEPRSDGISKLILVFDEPIDPASLISVNVAIAGLDANNAPIDCNSIAIGTSTRNGNTEAVITFTPALPDYAKYKVAVSGVTDAVGNPLAGDADRIMTALIGDVSADRRVNATDLSDVRATRTRLINKNNSGQVRADVSQDGRVNAADRSRVRVRRDNDARGISDPTIP